ncbi:hypothetical protein HU200_067030 [Digitaria exilis]|uniref:Uncharacterized protein n=1 Tax=Digitaria exilis TaxID=1010633 RepID=A0A835A058_9POAL|nr:hypothetical protein HU200_067030 [Digitaria exilis]
MRARSRTSSSTCASFVPRLPPRRSSLLLTAGGTYIDVAADNSASTTTTIGGHQLFIQRPTGCSGQQYFVEAVLEQVTRFQLLSLLEELLLLKDKELRNNGGQWADWLREKWSELKSSSKLSNNFDQDVEVIVGKLREGSGQSFICSYVSSHHMERTTIMGSHENTIAVDYKTVAITRMAEKVATLKWLEAQLRLLL